MKRFFNWLAAKLSRKHSRPKRDLSRSGAYLRQTGAHRKIQPAIRQSALPDRQPEFVDIDPHIGTRIDDNGPGKNVLIRNKYVREDTGTHDTLKILDDSLIDTEEELGIDPYNTGQFDRSKNWDKRFRN